MDFHSWIFKLNVSHRLISNGNHANLSQIVAEKDPNNNLYLNQQEKCEILIDPTLDYISRCLLEDVDEKINGYQEAALRDMEKPFYDIVGENYPPSEDNQSSGSPNFIIPISKDHVDLSFIEGIKRHMGIENLLSSQFQKGVEEGMKFLPDLRKSSIDLPDNRTKTYDNNSSDYTFRKEKRSGLLDKCQGKKSSNDGYLDTLEGRNYKIHVPAYEQIIRDEFFDKALLYHGEIYEREEISSLREIMKHQENSQNQEIHTNLRTLLISCAEAVSINNIKIAGKLIAKIRKQASPIGDGTQRFACVITDGLEARLAGAGSVTYRQLFTRQLSTTDFLKAFYMGIRASPVMRVSYHYANSSILNVVGTASKIHVIDFGIFFGFQWPSLIQNLAEREGGPPKLRITGVDFPQPGFRPAARVKETGRMLNDCARDYKVPFEYESIVSQWESICMDDLSIRSDEVLIINSMYRLNKIRDEPLLGMHSPRNKLLKLIHEAKPKVFVHGIFNCSYSPFFITRFKMVLSHYSKLFDMLDALIPRDNMPRQLIERTLYNPPIINQIACEGSDLVERPETYKQWHVRNLGIGFEQLPVDSSLLKECNRIVRNGYRKGFFIEEDCNWILQGWKGSIHYAISLWKPRIKA